MEVLPNLTIERFPLSFEHPKDEICGGSYALSAYQIHETGVIDGFVVGKSDPFLQGLGRHPLRHVA